MDEWLNGENVLRIFINIVYKIYAIKFNMYLFIIISKIDPELVQYSIESQLILNILLL